MRESIQRRRKVNRQESDCTSAKCDQLAKAIACCCPVRRLLSWLPWAELSSVSKWKALSSAEAELKEKHPRKENIGKIRVQAKIKAISSLYIQQGSSSFLLLASALIAFLAHLLEWRLSYFKYQLPDVGLLSQFATVPSQKSAFAFFLTGFRSLEFLFLPGGSGWITYRWAVLNRECQNADCIPGKQPELRCHLISPQSGYRLSLDSKLWLPPTFSGSSFPFPLPAWEPPTQHSSQTSPRFLSHPLLKT